MTPSTRLVSTASISNTKCSLLNLKISLSCASLHFFSRFSLTDRTCGYLPLMPFNNILVEMVTKNIDYKKSNVSKIPNCNGQGRGYPHSVTYLSYKIIFMSYNDNNLQFRYNTGLKNRDVKFSRLVRTNTNALSKSTLSCMSTQIHIK